MKKAIIISAALGLIASSALAQDAVYPESGPIEVYLESDTDGEVSVELADIVRKEVGRSRDVTLVESMGDVTRVLAPSKVVVTEDAKGKKVQMSYEISLPRGENGSSYKATCLANELDRCGDAVRTRLERVIREFRKR